MPSLTKIGRAARKTICFAILAAWPAAAMAGPSGARADFAGQSASQAARTLADRVVVDGDAKGLPFLIVDKAEAKVFAFDARGVLAGSSAALLGAALGDRSTPGIGAMRLSEIAPALRTTPAGRFEAALGTNLAGQGILWVDYDAAVSLHRVVTRKSERRLERLATPSPADNRITYGCINVPVAFYESVVEPLFSPADGIVYVLAETSADS
jgi:hypothetical protein